MTDGRRKVGHNQHQSSEGYEEPQGYCDPTKNCLNHGNCYRRTDARMASTEELRSNADSFRDVKKFLSPFRFPARYLRRSLPPRVVPGTGRSTGRDAAPAPDGIGSGRAGRRPLDPPAGTTTGCHHADRKPGGPSSSRFPRPSGRGAAGRGCRADRLRLVRSRPPGGARDGGNALRRRGGRVDGAHFRSSAHRRAFGC